MAENPEIPQYSPNPPPVNESCGGGSGANGLNIINPPSSGSGGKDAEVLAGFSMAVTDLSDINTDRFEVNYDPYDPVNITQTITAKGGGTTFPNPILKGITIDEINSVWSYNAIREGDINAQTIINTGAGSDPLIDATVRNVD